MRITYLFLGSYRRVEFMMYYREERACLSGLGFGVFSYETMKLLIVAGG